MPDDEPGSTAESGWRTFVRLLGFLGPYRASLIVSSSLAILSQLASVLVPVLTGVVINEIDGDPDTRLLVLEIAAIVALGVVRGALMYGRRIISGRQALGVEYDLRDELYSHFLRLSFGFYDRSQTGQLMSRATIDLQAVRFFLGYGLIFFAQHVVTIVVVTPCCSSTAGSWPSSRSRSPRSSRALHTATAGCRSPSSATSSRSSQRCPSSPRSRSPASTS